MAIHSTREGHPSIIYTLTTQHNNGPIYSIYAQVHDDDGVRRDTFFILVKYIFTNRALPIEHYSRSFLFINSMQMQYSGWFNGGFCSFFSYFHS